MTKASCRSGHIDRISLTLFCSFQKSGFAGHSSSRCCGVMKSSGKKIRSWPGSGCLFQKGLPGVGCSPLIALQNYFAGL